MKRIIPFFVLLLSIANLNAQESDYDNIFGPSNTTCNNSILFKVSVSNVGDATLTGTGIQVYVYTSLFQMIYSDTSSGPNIAPAATHQFDVTIPGGIYPGNDNYQVMFTIIADVDANPTPSSPFFSVNVTNCPLTFPEAIENMQTYIFENVNMGEDQVGYIYPNLISANTTVASYFQEEFDMIFTSDIYLGFVASDFASLFEQPCKYLVMNAQFGFVTEYDVNWYPVINGEPWNPIPFGDIQITEINIEDVPFEPFVFDPITSSPDTNVCALLIGGTDDNATLQASFDKEMETMKSHLTKSPFGPKLKESQVVIRKRISGDSLKNEIKKLNEGYEKIYLYYYGHGSRSGKLCTGANSDEWLKYEDLIEQLYETRAFKFCLFFDCCYSGKAIEAANNNAGTLLRDIEIITGASKDTTGTAGYYTQNGMRVVTGSMSNFFLKCSNEAKADSNNDQSVSFCEAYNWVISQNEKLPGKNGTIVERQNPQKSVNIFDADLYRDFFLDHINQNYSESSINDSEIFFNNLILQKGDIVRSFDESFEYILQNDFYFGWIDWLPNANFEKAVTYGFFDPSNEEVLTFDNIPFWPTIDNYNQYNPYDPSSLIFQGELPFIDIIPETIHTALPDPPEPKDSICALLVTGQDKNNQRLENAWKENVEMFKNNLTKEKFGPQLGESNVRNEFGISAAEIYDILLGMQGKYKKIYFYYAGHGNRRYMCTGKKPFEWYTYEGLLTDLNMVGAESYCIVLECCYAGNAITEQGISNIITSPNVEIYTSCNTGKVSYADFLNNGNNTTGYSAFTLNFLTCFGDPAAEKNMTAGITLKESFDWFYKERPSDVMGADIMTKQCPMHYVKKKLKKIGNEEGIADALDTDFSIRQRNRNVSSYDIDVVSQFNIATKPFDDVNVLAISEVREWNVTGALNADSSQTFDYVFSYDHGLDSLVTEEGTLGVVTKSPADSLWQIYSPSSYDVITHTITAEDVINSNQKFALARISGKSTSTKSGKNDIAFRIYPNPVNRLVTLHLNEAVINFPKIRLMSVKGQVLKSFEYEYLPIGENFISITLPDLRNGIYFLELTNGNGRVSKPIIVYQD